MPSLEECLEHADELAKKVVNAWAVNIKTGNAAHVTDDFRALFEKACRYIDAKTLADNHRESNLLTESEAAKETATREALAEACRDCWEKKVAA